MSELGYFHLPTVVKRKLQRIETPVTKGSAKVQTVKKEEKVEAPKTTAVKAAPKAVTGK